MSAASALEHSEEFGAIIRRRLVGFVRTLRDNGFAVGLAECRDALAILASPAARLSTSLMPALRALLCATRSEWERFDEVFDAYWFGHDVRSRPRAAAAPAETRPSVRNLAATVSQPAPMHRADQAESDDGSKHDVSDDRRARPVKAASAERLASTDLRHIVNLDEIAQIHALTQRLARRMRARLVRRQQARRHGRRLDLRRTIHRSVSHGGTPIDLVWRRRKRKPLRLVVLLDASGSMNPYTTFFMRFLHGVVEAFHESEAFVFHTRLAHVSASLRDHDVARAVDRLSLMAQGIGGGTQIGECLAAFNRWHAKRVINSRTAVMIVSDGYDTGEPERLGAEMRRLRRRCRRIIWLNPLLGWDGYAPEARGMRAALPHVSLFAAAHNLDSLAALEPYLARI